MSKVLIIGLLLTLSAISEEKKEEIDPSNIFLDKNSPYAKSLVVVLDRLEKSITARLEKLESSHTRLVILNPSVKDKQTIITEDIPLMYEDGFRTNLYRLVKFKFENGKIKEVILSSKKRRLDYNLHYVNRDIIFRPPNIQETEVRIEEFDISESAKLSDVSLDNRIEILKQLETCLQSSIYSMDKMIITYKGIKDKRNLYMSNIL